MLKHAVGAFAFAIFLPSIVRAQTCAPMSEDERMRWWCEQHSDDPNCESAARLMLPYISPYARCSGVDVAGRPMTSDRCDFSPKPDDCPAPSSSTSPPPPPPATLPTALPILPPPGNPTGSCGRRPDEVFRYSGTFKRMDVPRESFVSIQLPPVTESGRWAEIIVFETTNTPSDLMSIAVISTCPGAVATDHACVQGGSSWNSIDIHAFSGGQNGYCTLIPGETYYVTVWNANADGTPSCRDGACQIGIQYVGNLR